MIKEAERPESCAVTKTLRDITLHIQLRRHSGDTVQVHVPVSLLKICVDKNIEPAAILGKLAILKKLDLPELLKRLEQGEKGTVMTVTTKSGDEWEIVAQ